MLALAGCKTVENSLSQNDVAAMKLASVTVWETAKTWCEYSE